MTEGNLDVIRRGYDAFGRGDIDALLELFDQQIVWVTPGPPELETSGKRNGPQEVAGFFAAVNRLFDIQRFEPREFIAQGDSIVVIGSETVVARSTGKIVELDWAHVFKMRNGKVVAVQEFFDTAAVLAAMSVAHAPA